MLCDEKRLALHKICYIGLLRIAEFIEATEDRHLRRGREDLSPVGFEQSACSTSNKEVTGRNFQIADHAAVVGKLHRDAIIGRCGALVILCAKSSVRTIAS